MCLLFYLITILQRSSPAPVALSAEAKKKVILSGRNYHKYVVRDSPASARGTSKGEGTQKRRGTFIMLLYALFDISMLTWQAEGLATNSVIFKFRGDFDRWIQINDVVRNYFVLSSVSVALNVFLEIFNRYIRQALWLWLLLIRMSLFGCMPYISLCLSFRAEKAQVKEWFDNSTILLSWFCFCFLRHQEIQAQSQNFRILLVLFLYFFEF